MKNPTPNKECQFCKKEIIKENGSVYLITKIGSSHWFCSSNCCDKFSSEFNSNIISDTFRRKK